MTNWLIKLFVKDHQNTENPKVRENYGNLASLTGIFCNVLLSIIKIATGIIISSVSITADGLNNLSDTGSSVVTLIGFKMAGKPADSDHPFGHGRIEYVAAFIVCILILLVGGELVIGSAKMLINNSASPKYSITALMVMLASIVFKFWLFLFNRKIGKKIDSEALTATAQDSINDCIASLAIVISVVVGSIVKLPFNLDAVMAMLVGLFIIYSGLSAAKETIDDLLGTPPDQKLIVELKNTILSFKEFEGIHDLIIHNYGPGRQFASVHVEVPQNIDIVSCHEQIDLCEKLVNERTGVVMVIHMDPVDTDNKAVAKAKAQIDSAIKEIDSRITMHDFRMTPSGKRRTNLIFDVVIPSDFTKSQEQLKRDICLAAAKIDKTYNCVITVDNDYIGNIG